MVAIVAVVIIAAVALAVALTVVVAVTVLLVAAVVANIVAVRIAMPLDSQSTKVGPSSKRIRLSHEALCPALPNIIFLHHGAQSLLPILRH